MSGKQLHIAGIGGSFMSGLAVLAQQLGYRVSGSDQALYPPAEGQLYRAGICPKLGYCRHHLRPRPDLLLIGNALSRGNPLVEAALDQRLPFCSGPAWLARNLLQRRWVLAVAGTHGKTSTASMLAYILDRAGLQPGFLVGGVPLDFGVSARLGRGPFFVIEADEYDSAYFDKRPKFMHYSPQTLILNNLEYDHADIFEDLAAIKRQFGHLLRTVPAAGRILSCARDTALESVLSAGCWSPIERFCTTVGAAADWRLLDHTSDGGAFSFHCPEGQRHRLQWGLFGHHHMANALAAIAAARHAGVTVSRAVAILSRFKGVRRRMELKRQVQGITVYDDFAHHPTAIASTLAGFRAHIGRQRRILLLLEPGSYTMRAGVHQQLLPAAMAQADQWMLYQAPRLRFSLQPIAAALGSRAAVFETVEAMAQAAVAWARPGDSLLLMSNSGFGGLADRLVALLASRCRAN